jgi:hypothetical protein
MRGRTLRHVAHVALAALAVGASVGAAHAEEGREPRLRGGVIEPLLGLSAVIVNGPTISPLTGIGGRLFGGYKIDRVIIGLGVGISYNTTTERTDTPSGPPGTFTPTDAGASATSSVLSWRLMPGIRVALLRSPDRRVELYGQVDVGYYRTPAPSTSVSNGAPQTPPGAGAYAITPRATQGIPIDAGLGVRYWAHPQFSFGAVALLDMTYGWSGSDRVDYGPGGIIASTQSTSTSGFGLGLGGALVVLGVF